MIPPLTAEKVELAIGMLPKRIAKGLGEMEAEAVRMMEVKEAVDVPQRSDVAQRWPHVDGAKLARHSDDAHAKVEAEERSQWLECASTAIRRAERPLARKAL